MYEFVFMIFESITWPMALSIGFFLLFLNGAILTPSSELSLAVVGLYASTQAWLFMPAVFVTTTGNMAGFILLFLISRRYSDAITDYLKSSRFHYIKHMNRKAVQGFQKHGHLYVLYGRYIPNVRSVITIPAGFSDMPLSRFVLYSSFGSLSWSLVWVSVGFFLGPHLLRIIETHKLFAASLLLLTIAAVFVHRHFYLRSREDQAAI
jgi:membrane protein DedA with SNARE-associated domain